jgi:VIT1/CCC1 family predicted Fe2+/Mn2+ transporter
MTIKGALMDKIIFQFQKNEITEHFVYRNLAKSAKGKNRKVLEDISRDELDHYNHFKKITGTDISANWLKVYMYTFFGALFGITFASKMMEKGETIAQINYAAQAKKVKNMNVLIKDEARHEKALLTIIEEEKIGYISSMVLGLNDAIVELTGALAGFTFALQNTRVIGIAGFITGVAAALSMAAAEYLSQKSEDAGRNPLKAALYTGALYMLVVLILVAPYFILGNYYTALVLTLACVFVVILIFSFFVSTVQDKDFKVIFWEMTVICLGVSVIAFLIGLGARNLLKIDI